MKTKKLPKKGTPEWHKLAIARKTIKMPLAVANVMGGMTVEEAKQILNEYGLKS